MAYYRPWQGTVNVRPDQRTEPGVGHRAQSTSEAAGGAGPRGMSERNGTMTTTPDPRLHRARVQAQFGGSAQAYVASRGHASDNDLGHLVAWAREEGRAFARALDVATGGGHTALALAPCCGQMIASDLTAGMLTAAAGFIRGRDAGNVAFAGADAERLPFASGAFDLVACRIAPHHFADVGAFVREVGRVLRPGGLFLLEDSIVPEEADLDEFVNTVEVLRDPTHVRSLTASAWRGLLEGAGLAIEAELVHLKTHQFDDWVTRSRISAEERAALERYIRDATPATRAALAFVIADDGRIIQHTDEKLLLKARKEA